MSWRGASIQLDQPATSPNSGLTPSFRLTIPSLHLPHISPSPSSSNSSPPIPPTSHPLPSMALSPSSFVPISSPGLPPTQQPNTKPLLVYRHRPLHHPLSSSLSSPSLSPCIAQPSSSPYLPSSLPLPPNVPPPSPTLLGLHAIYSLNHFMSTITVALQFLHHFSPHLSLLLYILQLLCLHLLSLLPLPIFLLSALNPSMFTIVIIPLPLPCHTNLLCLLPCLLYPLCFLPHHLCLQLTMLMDHLIVTRLGSWPRGSTNKRGLTMLTHSALLFDLQLSVWYFLLLSLVIGLFCS